MWFETQSEFTEKSFDKFKSERLISWNSPIPISNKANTYNMTDAIAPPIVKILIYNFNIYEKLNIHF